MVVGWWWLVGGWLVVGGWWLVIGGGWFVCIVSDALVCVSDGRRTGGGGGRPSGYSTKTKKPHINVVKKQKTTNSVNKLLSLVFASSA